MSQAELLEWRRKKLEAMPKWVVGVSCRCRAFYALWLDTQRLMWCCDNCNLPVIREFNRCTYIENCVGCGNDFMKLVNNIDDPYCKSCGGENEAPKGFRNVNPGTIPEDYDEYLAELPNT